VKERSPIFPLLFNLEITLRKHKETTVITIRE